MCALGDILKGEAVRGAGLMIMCQLVFHSFNVEAAQGNDPGEVTFPNTLQVGRTIELKVARSQKRSGEAGRPVDELLEGRITLEVLEMNESGFLLAWRPDWSHVTTVLQHAQFANDNAWLKELLGELTSHELLIQTDKQGTPIKLVNARETTDMCRRLVDGMLLALPLEGEEQLHLETVLSQWFNSDAWASKIMQDASLYLMFTGRTFHVGEDYGYESELPNILGGKSLQTDVALQVTLADPATNEAIVHYEQQTDSAAVRRFLEEFFANAPDGDEVLAQMEGLELGITGTGEYQMNLKTGFPNRLKFEQVIQLGPELQRKDTTEIETVSPARRNGSLGGLLSIGMLSGHMEPSLSELTTLQQVFAEQYRFSEVAVSSGVHIGDDIAVLIIASPRRTFSNWEKWAIDQYIMRGGRVAFLIDKVAANLEKQSATAVRMRMDEWFENYGFHVGNNLIADIGNAGVLKVTRRKGLVLETSQVQYPYIPALRDFNRVHAMVGDLKRVSLYYVSSVDTVGAAGRSLAADALLMTSPRTKVVKMPYNIDPSQELNVDDFNEGQQMVGAALSGSFTSYFAGREVPAPNDSTRTSISDAILIRSVATRVVVVGDGEFFVDQKGGGDRDNLLFFERMVNWLVQDQ